MNRTEDSVVQGNVKLPRILDENPLSIFTSGGLDRENFMTKLSRS